MINVDTIKYFHVPQDTIWVDNADFMVLAGCRKLAASAFHAGAAAHDADDRMMNHLGRQVHCSMTERSAAGGAVQFATLSKGLGMTNADS